MEAKFKVRQDLAFWGFGKATFKPGEAHEMSGDADMIAAVEAAEAAGVLYDVELESRMTSSVESQEVSLVKLNQAMESGAWLEGHLAQFELDSQNGMSIEIGGDS